jgi:hypothetical protein
MGGTGSEILNFAKMGLRYILSLATLAVAVAATSPDAEKRGLRGEKPGGARRTKDVARASFEKRRSLAVAAMSRANASTLAAWDAKRRATISKKRALSENVGLTPAPLNPIPPDPDTQSPP